MANPENRVWLERAVDGFIQSRSGQNGSASASASTPASAAISAPTPHPVSAPVPTPVSAPASIPAPIPALNSASNHFSAPLPGPSPYQRMPAPMAPVAGPSAPSYHPVPRQHNNSNINNTQAQTDDRDLTEGSYQPLITEGIAPPDPNAPTPLYPAYTFSFSTSQEARLHRKRRRLPPKSQATDISRVKNFGRRYWVRRIYSAMIDISNVTDGPSSIHRARFESEIAFDPLDLEAAAHHVFDAAVAVHELGWNRPLIYHKKVVRGKLVDISEKSLERRLARICLVLEQKKAVVDDAVRGGVTLALLVDNPEARGFTKFSNNAGNEKRGRKLRAVKGMALEGDDVDAEEE